ncbi:fatty acid desaturase [Klebsiella pneumoniae]|nr:fatty acid desaturase [Klebsiella pneumoniae]
MAAQGFLRCGLCWRWYPALALTKVRSFLEHRAADDPLARSVINEAGLPRRVLFLNLNYHAVHHDLRGVPWYALRQLYLHRQAAVSAA